MLNNVCIMGRLARDPEARRTPAGTAVSNFTIACDRRAKPGEEKKADFIDCVAWSGTADFVTRYFKKGDSIIISGRLQAREYEDKNGNKRKAVEVVASEINFAGKKRDTTEQAIDAEDFDDSELPF